MATHLSSSADARRKATVLVVEDDPILRLTLASEVHAAGFRVLEAANTNEAETVLATGAPVDLVITDIQMPGPRDGLALARIVRSSRPETKVIVASGVEPPPGVVGVADAFFAKPYDVDRVVGRIASLIGTREPD